ncbi:hypothetical protein [Erythrobacter aureus]|uniref:hypothetical protein n=1 Tax=Erythrobacter aureus TaxID=2182384 RepID=UPI003A8FBED2
MARSTGIDPKRFRAALRQANISWHPQNGRWEALRDSAEHRDMLQVLEFLTITQRPEATGHRGKSEHRSTQREDSDEAWIVGLCDEVLGEQSLRQYRLAFLTGDRGPTGRAMRLPVDAYYPSRQLVVEFHEIQHSQSVAHFDKRQTVSGVSRGEQRRRYDELRRAVLPMHGIDLVILDYSEFAHGSAGRLKRTDQDRRVIEDRLRDYIKP